MRVLLVTHRYPPHTGGVETHVRELAVRLVERGHDVTVFSADAGSDVPTESTHNGVFVRRFRSFSPGGAFHLAPRIAPAVRRAEADVVHAHNYHAFPLFFAALGVTDERFVVTPHYHGESANGVRDALLSLYRPVGARAIRRAAEVVAVSEWERERLRADFGVEARVIPNGVDAKRFAAAEPEPRERPYVLCVGRLEEYKGIQHAVRAMAELPDYDLVVAGRGPYRGELERTARETGVVDRVEFLGYVDDGRLPDLYAGADAYVTLSAFEAYGMTVAEALASRTPCVVRAAGALRDWIGENGVVGVGDVSAETVARGIRRATAYTGETASPPTWDGMAERVAASYRSG